MCQCQFTTINRVGRCKLSTNGSDAISASTSINRQAVVTRLGGNHVGTTTSRDGQNFVKSRSINRVNTSTTSNGTNESICSLSAKRQVVGTIGSSQTFNVIDVGEVSVTNRRRIDTQSDRVGICATVNRVICG